MLNLYKIEGFECNSVTRAGRRGGGELVYSRTQLAAQPCVAPLSADMRSAEYVMVKFDHGTEPTYIISIYRPPRINKKDKVTEFLHEFRLLLENLPSNNKIIFCGDININLLNSLDTSVIIYENLLAEFGFTKCIHNITRREILKGNLVESCLDHIYIRAPNATINSAVIEHKISDHYCIAAALDWNSRPRTSNRVRARSAHGGGAVPQRPAISTNPAHVTPAPAQVAVSRNLTRRVLDNRAVREMLLCSNFDDLMRIDCPIKLYEAIRNLFTNIYESCYISVNIKNSSNSNRGNNKWISEDMKKIMLERDRLFKIWSNEPKNMIKRLNYTTYRNKCMKTCLKRRNEYDKQCILDCNKNIKKIWDKLNSLLGNDKQSLDDIITKSMNNQSNLTDICNNFAATFSDEIEDIKHICNDTWLDRDTYVSKPSVSMRWSPVSSKQVAKVISSLSADKSAGSDLVRMRDLKLVVEQISPVIAKLTNLCVKHSKFPDKLKEALVRPIHKKGDKKNYSNYRPIAILSSIDKIIEKCIINQIGTFLRSNNVLSECQHGFQRGKSTGTLLSKFTDEVNNYLNDKNIILAVFYDFKKAFDTLQHETLLRAMEECGVGGPLNRWFRDYLTARSFSVRVGEAHSIPVDVRCGVPQGSGCGPVCYLMHVNSLCNVLKHSSAHMFADDLCTLHAGTDLTAMLRLVQQDIDSVVRWSHDNGIVLNTDKTKLLIIHSPYSRLPDNVCCNLVTHSFTCLHSNNNICDCKPIERVPFVTYLGMRVDEHFAWTYHIDYICNKLRILLDKFYHLRFKVPTNILKCMYMALVDSIVSYGLDCYGLTFKSHINKIESLQIRFLKLLVSRKTKNKCNGNYTTLFKICNVLPVSLKHTYLLILNNHSNPDHRELVEHGQCTRTMSTGRYVVPRVNNYFGDRTLRKRIPYLYNMLPVDIRQECNINKFRKSLFKHLMQKIS
ncbi:uncharacterized protein LOC126380976 [Pectinophora gossypiella]|uniref:uncharacterized protein LOC126380976 n=1 Tax=Pectinophora gossypiella TaxID=13191 RepID=UPI00214E89A8|nr:uncharacterized protein LOC126380976 [Pectinophora gossypiella]